MKRVLPVPGFDDSWHTVLPPVAPHAGWTQTILPGTDDGSIFCFTFFFLQLIKETQNIASVWSLGSFSICSRSICTWDGNESFLLLSLTWIITLWTNLLGLILCSHQFSHLGQLYLACKSLPFVSSPLLQWECMSYKNYCPCTVVLYCCLFKLCSWN